ncbi:MAG: hypothetical protein A3F68_10085 [Acidobacteria bacterium RIFCSPLOWO2_12_FULL_54_10]|nr:MAG: hypothetical protein A3F68_10085 [Acidobacteria bacterium RIFCSPLOWO2_12_FULL_54_10]
MYYLRSGLLTGLLLLACIIGLQITYILHQASASFAEQHLSALDVAQEARQTMLLARSVMEEQRGYYRDTASHIKALTRAAAIDAIRFGRLIDKMDQRTERLTTATEAMLFVAKDALAGVQDSTQAVANMANQLGDQPRLLLEASTEAAQALQRRADDPNLNAAAESLAQSSANVERMTASAAEATGYVRDMLSPQKKSFWRRILELMIPRPSINIK